MKSQNKTNHNVAEKVSFLCALGLIFSILLPPLGLIMCVICFLSKKSGRMIAIVGVIISVLKFICFDMSNFYPSISPYLSLNTACTLLDENGNYVYQNDSDDNLSDDVDGQITCENYVCWVTYEGEKYTGNCKK